MFKRIDHVAVHVSNIERSVEFYTRHFGFSNYFTNQTPSGIKIEYLQLGDTLLELTECAEDTMAGLHFCLEASDFDKAISKLTKSGITMESEPHHTAPRKPEETGWKRVVFIGPDNEKIEIRG
jgi:lactoylglutathione lyase